MSTPQPQFTPAKVLLTFPSTIEQEIDERAGMSLLQLYAGLALAGFCSGTRFQTADDRINAAWAHAEGMLLKEKELKEKGIL